MEEALLSVTIVDDTNVCYRVSPLALKRLQELDATTANCQRCRSTSVGNKEESQHKASISGNSPCFLGYPDGVATAYSDSRYHVALEWLSRTLHHLDALENLGYGMKRRRHQLHCIERMKNDEDISECLKEKVTNVLKGWISFDQRFRDTYAAIAQNYHRLLNMEVNMNLLRTNSLHMLEKEEMNGYDYGVSISPSSKEAIRNSEIYGKLVSIWYTKLSALRSRNINEFKEYVLDAVSELQHLPIPQQLHILDEVEPTSALTSLVVDESPVTTGAAAASYEFTGEDVTPERGHTNEDKVSSESGLGIVNNHFEGNKRHNHQKEGVVEYSIENEDVQHFVDEGQEEYDALVGETVNMFNDYCNTRGINDESALDSMNRLTDLKNRLLPRFLKACDKIPVYCDEYMNSLHDQFLIYKKCNDKKVDMQRPKNRAAPTTNNGKVDVSPPQIARKTSVVRRNTIMQDAQVVLPKWTNYNSTVRSLSLTNLNVLDVLRCGPSDTNVYRKLVVLTRGSLRDIFLNRGGASSTAHVDLRALVHTDKQPHVSDDDVEEATGSGETHVKGITQSLMRALLTEDLAEDEIDNVVSTWFPKLCWMSNAECSKREDIQLDDDEIGWYPQNKDLTGDYTKIHSDAWFSRLRLFHSLTSRHQLHLRHEATQAEPGIKYDSSFCPNISDFPPLKVLSDFSNHIPIKYTMKTKNGDGHFVWIQSLFGWDSIYGNITENLTEQIILDELMLPSLSNDYTANAVVVPIHQGAIELSDSYRMIGDICDCMTDYVFPPLYEQHIFKDEVGNGDGDSGCGSRPHAHCHIKSCLSKGSVDTNKLGSVFLSRHSNLCLGSQWALNQDKCKNASVPIIFYLVACNDQDNEGTCVYNPDSPENVRVEMDNMREVLNGLSRILQLCNEWKVATLSIPVDLRCSLSGDGSGKARTAHSLPTSKDQDATRTSVRCLATVTHLSTAISCGAFPLAINIIFPESLSKTEVERNAVNVFINHLGAF